MKNEFNFCPNCGSKSIKNIDNIKWVCPDCNFVLYCNIAAAVGIIIHDKYSNVLFELRAKEPRKGFACLPGGFVNKDESAEDGILRECKEEIGVEVKDIKFLCSKPNIYPYKNIEYKTCDFFFVAELPSEYDTIEEYIKSLTAEKSEVSGFVSYNVKTLEDIENIPLAFESAKETLKVFIEKRKG